MEAIGRGARAKKMPLVLLSAVISIILIVGGMIYFRYQAIHIQDEKYANLKTVAELKIDQLMHWKADRLANAEVYSQRQGWINFARNFNRTSNQINSAVISKQIKFIISNYDYECLSIVNPKLQIIKSSDKIKSPLDSTAILLLNKVLRDKKIITRDFYFDSTHNKILYDIYAPMIDNNEIVGILILKIDPNIYLFPLIQFWPESSKTSETLIVRRDKDSVLFLNELRKMKNTALKLRISLAKKEIPAVQALLGYKGIFEGIDYTGEEVLSYISPVPTTHWYMISKIDKKEAFEQLNFVGFMVALFVVVLILFTGISVSLLYHSRQKRVYKELYFKESDLRKIQKEFRATLYSIGDAVLTTDLNGEIQNMNPVAERLTGYKEEHAHGKNIDEIFKIIDEFTGDEVINPVSTILSERKIVDLINHTLLISKDGNHIPISDSGAPIFDENGNMTGVVLVFRDQTNERNIQKSLQESEERYRKLFHSTIDGICLHELIIDNDNNSVDYKILDVNPKYESITNLKRKDVIGMPATKIYGTGEPPYLEIYANVALTGQPVNFETYFEPMDKYFNISVFSPEKQKFATVFQDITERKKNEKLLIESEERYRSLFENMLNGFAYCKMIYQNDEPADFIYISVNNVFETLTGLRNVVGKRITEIIPNIREESKDLFEIYGDVALNGKPRNFESYVKGLDMWFNVSVYSPKREYFVAIFDVITERKRAEEKIKNLNTELEKKVEIRTKQLAQANKELEAFAYSVSHDLRAPLRAIDGFSRILQDDYAANLDEEGKRICNVIQDNSNWMGRLIDDLLSFSRLSHSEISKMKVDMEKMAKSVYEGIATDDQKRNVVFEVGKLLPVECDNAMIRQVWINLIGNALKFSSRSSDPRINIECKLENSLAIYSIRDNGVGFNMKYAGKLFNVFQRLHSMKEFEGTGVGLALVKRIVTKHGGDVWADAEIDKGAIFYFSLPL